MIPRKKRVNGGPEPVRVFVGASAGGEDAEACAVLEHSLRSRASVPVELAWAALSRDPQSPFSGWRTEEWPTPWNALRWAVPAAAGWRGRAIYLDCPQVVLGDVAELAAAPVPEGAFVLLRREGRTARTGCMVFDCAAARRWLQPLREMRADPAAHQAVGALLEHRPELAGALPAGWGMRDADYSADPAAATGSVHCANIHMQPHTRLAARRLRREGREHWFLGVRLPHFCPGLVDLFDREYAAAVAAGYGPERYVPDEPWGDYAIAGARSGLGEGKRA